MIDLKELRAGSSTMYRAGWQTRDPGESWYSFESEGRLEAEFLLSWGDRSRKHNLCFCYKFI